MEKILEVKWKKVQHWSMRTEYVTIYRNEELGLEKHSRVRRTFGGYDVGSSKDEFYKDGDKKKYKSLDQILNPKTKQ